MAEANIEKTCNVTVTSSDKDATTIVLEDGYDMLDAFTPRVTDVSPRRGGTGGGTAVTITGTGFSTTQNEVNLIFYLFILIVYK